MEPDPPPELLTTVEVARTFRVARSTVVGWAEKGLLPSTRTPTGKLRFYRDDVLGFLRERHRPAREEPGP